MMETLRNATRGGGNASRMLVVFSDGLSTTQLDPQWVARTANLLGVPIYPVVLGHKTAGNSQGRKNMNSQSQLSVSRNGQMRSKTQEDFINPRRKGGTASGRATTGNAGNQGSARAKDREMRQMKFAELGPQTGGRSFDLKIPSGMAIRSILTSISTLAQSEYIVGYYPSSLGEEPTERKIEVRLNSTRVGKLYGGRRSIVH